MCWKSASLRYRNVYPRISTPPSHALFEYKSSQCFDAVLERRIQHVSSEATHRLMKTVFNSYLLHIGNSLLSIPVSHAVNMKETY